MKPIFDPPIAGETELIRRCQSGERDAFAPLVDVYKNWIHAHLYRWVRLSELAEEMAQEVFLKAFSQIKNFRGESKFSTWIFQIALNLYRDHGRLQARRGSAPISFQESEYSNSAFPSAETKILQKEREDLLGTALQALPEIYRETLMLRFLSERSLEEIAQIQGQGLSNVKMRIARGLGHLRKKMEGKNES